MVFIKNGKKWQHVLSVVVLESVDCILGFRAEVSVAEVSDAGQHVELLVDLGVHGRGHDLHVGKCVGDGVDTCSIYQTYRYSRNRASNEGSRRFYLTPPSAERRG